MRGKAILLLGILLPLTGAGCGLLHTGTSVIAHKAREAWDDCTEKCRNRAWAREAWDRVCGESSGAVYSKHHARGFEEGFASYLYRGGSGEPPSVPPFEYRGIHGQTPEGYQASLDWFAGYRHGSAVAREGGYRDLITGPSVLRTIPALAPAPASPAVPVPFHVPSPSAPPGPATDRPPMPTLPVPNPVEPRQQVQPTGWTLTIDLVPLWNR